MSGGDMVQCSGCTAMAQGVPAPSLPRGCDGLFVPMDGLHLFCVDCVRNGRMEWLRARNGLTRRAHWRLPDAVLAIYRPAARQVLIVTPDGMAELDEDEAEKLRDALTSALAMRFLATSLSREAAGMITVIFGPMATGKTFHSKAFAVHYRCSRVLDSVWVFRGRLVVHGGKPIGDGDLLLTTMSVEEIRKAVLPETYRSMRFIPITDARRAIGAPEFGPCEGGAWR